MYLGQLPEKRLSTISELAETFCIPKNHLMKVISELGRFGYIETVRGSKGGVKLKKESLSMPLGNLINQFEARMDLINCDEPACPVSGACALKSALVQAQSAFINSLNSYTLASLIKNSHGLEQLIKLDESEATKSI
jgi:Rrf2 family nitric oxide-sensitive transcriptional repressor